MKVKCKVCGKYFETEPIPQTLCGTTITAEDPNTISTIKTICPDCEEKQKSENK